MKIEWTATITDDDGKATKWGDSLTVVEAPPSKPLLCQAILLLTIQIKETMERELLDIHPNDRLTVKMRKRGQEVSPEVVAAEDEAYAALDRQLQIQR